MVIKAHPNYRPFAAFSCGDTTRLLDAHSGSAAAYSLRKLKANYAGNAIRVRRSNDNSEQDIGFDICGNLDTATLKTFIGGNSGFITTWYSQGDSASVNFTQTTAASQPRIVNAGVIDRTLGEPSVFFDGSNDFMDVTSSTTKFNFLHNVLGDASVFILLHPGIVSNPDAAYSVINNINSTANVGFSILFDDRSSVPRNETLIHETSRGVSGNTTLTNISSSLFAIPNQTNLYTILADNNNTTAAERSIIYRNGGNEQKNNAVTNTASNANASFNLRMGRLANGILFNLNGYISEIIIYPNKTVSKSGVESNINTYYGIY
jgi:hypothetical protein